jgi:predicted amidophosphoribosyltransferase
MFYSFKYYSPRHKTLSITESIIREISYEIKDENNKLALKFAANELVKFVKEGDILVPAPNSLGDISANLALSRMIAKITDVTICDLLTRSKSVTPTHCLKKQGIPINKEHNIISNKKVSFLNRILVVDNVITTGNTIMGCKSALSRNNVYGLCFAKA